jgi:hypothetical protein
VEVVSGHLKVTRGKVHISSNHDLNKALTLATRSRIRRTRTQRCSSTL